MNRWTVLYACVLAAALLALGCSGSNNPVTPNNGLTEREITSGPTTQTHLWGYYDIYIDVANQTVEAVPNRNVAFTANVVGFVNKPASNLAFDIWGTPVDPGGTFIDVDIDVSITHPFPGMNQYDGYDVRGIFMGTGSASLQYDSSLVFAQQGGTDQIMYDYDLGDDPDIGYDDPYAGLVGMPDGFTRWWNPTEFGGGILGYIQGKLATPGYENSISATLNPYKYFADDLGAEEDVFPWLVAHAADGYFVQGIFTSGSTNTRNYYLRFPTPDPNVMYGYAIAADWGEHEAADPPPDESHMVETPAIQATYNGDAWYFDGSSGGNFAADIDIWHWDYQPSTVTIETSMHSVPVTFDDTNKIGGTDNYSTWHVEFTPDSVTQADNNEYWVIAEYSGFDYSAKGTEYAVPGTYPEAPLAAFFHFDNLSLLPEPPCEAPILTGINPTSAEQNTQVNDCQLLGDLFEEVGDFTPSASLIGEITVVGTDVKWVDINTMTADFNLTGAPLGLYDLEVSDAECDKTVTIEDVFEVLTPTSGLSLKTTGALPTPLPTCTVKDFSVQGDDSFGEQGIYYMNNTGSNYNSYPLYQYPLDYGGNGTLACNLTGNYGYTMDGCYGNISNFKHLTVTANGVTFSTSGYTGPGWGGYPSDGNVYWYANTGVWNNGWIYFNMRFNDPCNGFAPSSQVFGFWGNNPAGVDGETAHFPPPFGPYDYASFDGYYPPDHTGSVDGLVSDNEARRYAIDDDPEGLNSPFNMIHYYLESAPDSPGIEVMKNVSYMAYPVSITTIDDAQLTGTPIDICVAPTFGNAPSATNNWLISLEDNGDSTWNLVAYQQDGTLVNRVGPYDGTPWNMDVDVIADEPHVWFDDAGTPSYAIFNCN